MSTRAWDDTAAARPGPDQGLRALRLLPADVPELRGLRGRDGLAARADRADARRPRGGQRGLAGDDHAPRPLPRLHGVRDRVPVGRPVRPADRARAAADRAPRRRARAASARCATGDLRALHPPRPAARARCRSWRCSSGCRARRSRSREPGARRSPLRARRCGGCPRSRPRVGERRGRIALMQGCVQRVFFGDVNAATVRVLAAEGWEVHAPRRPRCCGALQLHAGVEDEARELARGHDRRLRGLRPRRRQRRRLRLGDEGVRLPARGRPSAPRRSRPRCATSTSCWPTHEPQAAAPPARRCKVAYHDACHLAHAQQVRAQPRELLRGDPRLELLEPAEWELCCGSAGIYNLVQPEAGRRARPRARPRTSPPPAPRRSPPPTRAARSRSPRTWTARRPDLPPDDPARPLDQREPTVSPATSPRPQTTASPRSCPTTRSPSSASCTAASAPAATELLQARARARRAVRLPRRRRARSARATGRSRRRAPDYDDRRVEITGPTDRKLVINALNSGAKGFMADFEDANSPTWSNQVEGHVNLIDAIDGTITYDSSDGKHYELNDEIATLLVRPRGWHLPEKHLQDRRRAGRGRARRLRPARVPQRAPAARQAGSGSTSTCPRWSTTSRRGCGTTSSASPRTRSACRAGTIRATVLIETLPGRVPDGRDPLRAARALATASTPAAGTTSSR